MEVFKKLNQFYLNFIKCPNVENFDEDFQQILQIFYILGFYHPRPSKLRMTYGAFMYTFLLQTHVLGNLKDIYVAMSFEDSNMNKALICAISLSFAISLKIQVMSFVMCQKEIIQMIKEFHLMHELNNESSMKVYRQKCSKLVKFHQIIMGLIELTLIMFKLFGYDFFILAFPAVYDELARKNSYDFFLVINIVQFTGILMLYNAGDLLHILCMIRAEANLEYLNKNLRHCTDSKNLKENEESLIACVELHCRIITETNNLQKLFKKYFISKAHCMFLELTFLFFIFIQVDEKQTVVIATLCVTLALFQFGTLCYIGQRLTSESADLMNSSYECQWYTQSQSFKKTLMIFRIVAKKELKINARKFDFSHGCFYEIISTSYNYYNNLCTIIGV